MTGACGPYNLGGSTTEAHFGSFADCANLHARSVYGLGRTYHRLRNHFRRTQWYSKVTRLNWKLVSVRLEIVVILMRDRCTVCAKFTIGLEIVLDAPDGTPRWQGTSGSSFSVRLDIVLIMTQDWCMVCAERTIHSEIDLDANNGTPR